MRSMWTAAIGMRGQQFNIDTIANNLSNVNTTGYKTQRAEFKDLLYTNMRRNNIVDDQGRPVNLQVGHGVMPAATKKSFKNGSLIESKGEYDVGINGEGFFAIQLPNGNIRYTRDGSFKLSVEGNSKRLVTSEGYRVLSDTNNDIVIRDGLRDVTIDQMGNITAKDEGDNTVNLGRFKLVRFINPEGLLNEGSNLYSATVASGDEIPIAANEMESKIAQGYLEASNVEVVDEMVKMISAQRAYEISSKVIHTSDEMLQLISNLKR
ncbi:MAG: flagellar basal-body rod protein FlgG [Clostridiaceae bacterium]|nr:flagellar basal-body rod protein FlgG [Clostridiaceae bacterium]MBW4860035.1 flagellar basal-body rod protein FlgG [Clostridiaceae bacterium]MBW4867125.1 flagellar basal-body rod protein FlgG [Clostridiaceae bacterium]